MIQDYITDKQTVIRTKCRHYHHLFHVLYFKKIQAIIHIFIAAHTNNGLRIIHVRIFTDGCTIRH